MTQFDLIVSIIALIFMTLGLFKGAIKSILGLGKWYGAGVLTLLFYPRAKDAVAAYIQPGMVANGAAVIITYIAALIVISLIIGIFVAALGSTVGGPGDKILGAAVGLTIGLILASTAHYFIRSFAGGTDPDWMKNGKTYQITSKGADKMQDYFKNVVQNMGADMGFVNDIDVSGSLTQKIQDYQNGSGGQIDIDKLKEAVRMMKGEGMGPSQIKDMINIEDYKITGEAADNTDNGSDIVKKIQDTVGSTTSKIQKSGSVINKDDYYENLRTYKPEANKKYPTPAQDN